MRTNKTKLKNLILYILREYNNKNLTETKLQKLLYFCDFNHYFKNKKSITGYKYRKNLYGPTIMTLPTILAEMKNAGLINLLRGTNYFGSPQKTFSLADHKTQPEETFSDSELLTINSINKAYEKLTPREISYISHMDFPYLATKAYGNLIDYKLVFYREGPDEEPHQRDENAISFFTSPDFSSLMTKVDEKLYRVSKTN